jgi:hypothetical protein
LCLIFTKTETLKPNPQHLCVFIGGLLFYSGKKLQMKK